MLEIDWLHEIIKKVIKNPLTQRGGFVRLCIVYSRKGVYDGYRY